MASLDSFKARKTLTAGGKTYTYYSLPDAEKISGEVEITVRVKNASNDMNQEKYQELLKRSRGIRKHGYKRSQRKIRKPAGIAAGGCGDISDG